MTREDAIQILSTRDWSGMLCGYTGGYTEALDLAIEALKILGEDGIVNCCGCIHWNEEGFCKMTDRRRGDFDYCSDGRRE